MSLDFGKLDFAVSLNRQTAFPLDARSYFESLASAEAAARTAEAAGSKNTTYYFGQTICVVENDIASMYIIQPDGTLGEIGEKIQIDTNQFEFKDGSLSLIGFAEAVAEAQLVKNADGTIGWVKPDNSVVEGLSTDVESLKNIVGAPAGETEATGIFAELDKKANVADVYSKEDADQAIASAIADVSHLKREIFDSKIAAENAMADYGDSADQYIYMVARVETEDGNHYDEYMAFKNADEEWTLEKIGDWGVDLSTYAKTEDVNKALDLKANIADVISQLNTKVDKLENYSLMSNLEHTKLEGIEAGAQVNFIKAVDVAQFNVDDTGKLKIVEGYNLISNENLEKLNGIEAGAQVNFIKAVDTGIFKVENGTLELIALPNTIVEGLDTKYIAKNGTNRLITEEEARKLESLVLGDDNKVEISGKVNASNVQELYSAVVKIVTGEGQSEYDGIQKDLLGIEAGAQVNFIKAVDTASFSVDNNGSLGLVSIPASALITTVGDLTQLPNSDQNYTLVDEINNIYQLLTWTDI